MSNPAVSKEDHALTPVSNEARRSVWSQALDVPHVRQVFWRSVYYAIARLHERSTQTFLNYGYLPLEPGDNSPALGAADEDDRTFIQLYHRVTRELELRDREVLEVGCGYGGGSSFLARYRGPRAVVGVDFSRKAVESARARHSVPNLSFEVGNACALPFPSARFDVVVNLESSHCYRDIPAFAREVARVLGEGGEFAWADMIEDAEVAHLDQTFRGAGLVLRTENEITGNVLAALDATAEWKRGRIDGAVPGFLREPVRTFAGVPGTAVYQAMRDGHLRYLTRTYSR